MVTTQPIDPEVFLKEIREIGKEVQMVTSEILEKCVPLPKHNNSLGDLLVGLIFFRNVVRWKEFFLSQRIQQKENEEKQVKAKMIHYIRCMIKRGRKGVFKISQEKLKTNNSQRSTNRIK